MTHAGEQLAERARGVVPEVQLSMATEPVVRFVPTPEGPVFDVQIPLLLQTGPALFRAYQRPAQPVSQPAPGANRVSSTGVVVADPMEQSPVQAQVFDPDKEYTAFAREALIDALLDNSGAVPLKDGERLEITASGLDIVRAPLYPDNSRKLMLVISAADLVAFRQAKITREEAKARIVERRYLIYNSRAMFRRPLILAVALVAFAGGASCGSSVDLAKSLTIVDTISGYYDNGLKGGWNYLMPSVTFRLENRAPESIRGLELTVAFWRDDADGEWDSVLVQRIGDDVIPANGKSDLITVRGTVGYRLEDVRSNLFSNSEFKEVTAKVFARRGGTVVPIGQYPARAPDHPACEFRRTSVSASAVRSPAASSAPTLARRLGPYDAATIVISNVVGGGIFFIPVMVAGLVPSGWAMLGAWVVGGVLAFAGAMAYAELATLRPHAGGEYVYLREAFGPLAAFLSGWTSFVAGFSGAIAAGTVALSEYLGRFLPAAADKTPLATLPLPFLPLVVTPQALVAIGAIFLLSLVHLHLSGRFLHNILTAVKVVAISALILFGLTTGRGSAANMASAHAVAAPVTGWLLALIPIMFAYSGWNAATYVAEEIRDPSRNLPRALGYGTLAVVGVYVALNVLYLYAMPIADLATLPDGRLTDVVAERLFSFAAGELIAVFTIVGIAASVSAMVLAGPRIYYAMARDGVFLASAGRVHPRFRTPVLAIIAQAIWSSVLVLSATLSQLVAYTGFSVVLFSGIAVIAVFVLRRRDPREDRPFRALGYPVAPALFVAASFVMVVNEVWNNPGTSLAGLAVIAAGLPLYFWLGRQRAATVRRSAASATSVAAASVPSLAAKSRNDAGEPLR